MNEADYWIERLALEAHPEGGFFREVYRSHESIESAALPERYDGARCLSTSIYYLLRAGEHSRFHRHRADEVWHFHAGGSLQLYTFDLSAGVSTQLLGPTEQAEPRLQLVIPAGVWMAAEPSEGAAYSLVGCTVAPGFEFEGLEFVQLDSFSNERRALLRGYEHLFK